MPGRPQRFCSHPGCRTLVEGGRCARHRAVMRARELARQKDVDGRRAPETRGFYSTPRWRDLRARVISEQPRCPCGGLTRYADHIVPWMSGPTPEERDRLKWDRGNLQGLCASCHSRKTASTDGGFGNRRPA